MVTTDIFLLANEKKISTSNKDHLTKTSFDEMDANMDGKVDLKEFIRACDRHNYIIFHYLKTFVTTYKSKDVWDIDARDTSISWHIV